jgi:hypothetical protein
MQQGVPGAIVPIEGDGSMSCRQSSETFHHKPVLVPFMPPVHRIQRRLVEGLARISLGWNVRSF